MKERVAVRNVELSLFFQYIIKRDFRFLNESDIMKINLQLKKKK